jgi:regulator of protease activity HflC (stomatin/prohibitin superfamily)
MQKNFGDRFGFEIQSLRIEKIQFADKTIQKQVSELAMTYTRLSAQEATIAAQKKVQLAEAERDAASQLIQTRAEAERTVIKANATNDTMRNKMRVENEVLQETMVAKMNALRVETETIAQNKVILAESEARAIIQIGEAEIEILRKKNELPHAQLRIIADAQKEVLSGVNKVIYTTEQSLLTGPYLGYLEKNN